MDSKHFLILTSIIFFSAPLWGDTYTVSSEADAGPGSLRQAILDLNETGNTATNTITINSGLPPILLNSKLPVIQRTAKITTSGTVPQIIDGNQNRLFVANANLTIENCNIQNGAAIGGNGISNQGSGGGGGLGAGGGVYVAPNTVVTLNNTSLKNNLAQGGKGASGFQNLKGGGFSGSGGGASFSSADPNASRTQGGGDNPGQHGSMGNPVAIGGNEGGNGGTVTAQALYDNDIYKVLFIGSKFPGIGGFFSIAKKFTKVDLTPQFDITDGESGSSSENLSNNDGGGKGGSTTGSIYEFLTSDQVVDGGTGGKGGAGGGGGGGAYVAQPPTLFEQVANIEFNERVVYAKIQLVSQPGNGGDKGGGGGGAANLRNGGGGGGYGSGGGGGSSVTLDISTPKPKRGDTPGATSRTPNQAIAQLVPITGFGSGGGGGFGGGGGGGGGDLTTLPGATVKYTSGGRSKFGRSGILTISVGRNIPYQGGGGGGGGGFGGGGGGNDAFLQEEENNLAKKPKYYIFKEGMVSQGGNFGGNGGGQAQQIKPYAGSGGGGAGIGGAVFVGNNAQLIIQDSVSLRGNQTQGGEAGTDSVGSDIALPAGPGLGFADDIFLYSDAKLVFQNENSLLADFSIQSDPGSFQDIGVRKEGSGTVTMTSQKNNYRGPTVIKEGTIVIASDVLGFRSSELVFAGGTLEATDTFSLERDIILNLEGTIAVNPSRTLFIGGPIRGEGSLTKTDAGTLVLTETVPMGNLIIKDGTVQGNASYIQNDVLINSFGTLIFDQNFSGAYEGQISGNGTLVKDGTERLSFIGVDDFAGNTIIQNGTLVIPVKEKFASNSVNVMRGTLQNNGTINAGVVTNYGYIFGSGTFNISIMKNFGFVEPGNSIGTLTINGNYTQDPSGRLGIEIDVIGGSDLLEVTGMASLNGELLIKPTPGVYLEGTTYTFLTAESVTGQFSRTVISRPFDYTINYLPNQVQLFLKSPSVVVGMPDSNLTGNPKSVADCLFCNNFDFANTDLVLVANALLQLPMDEYAKALKSLTPAAFGSLPLVELENNFNFANTFFLTGVGQRSYCYADIDEPTNIWFNPLGFIYSQEERQGAPGFTARTWGVAVGADRLFLDEWSLGIGFGYSHAQLDWKHQVGHAHADSIYLGPYVKYDCENFYFDFLLLGVGNFYDVDRKIVFPGLSRKAHSDPTTWNLSEILLAGFRLEPFHIDNFFVQPEIRLDQTNSFQGKFKEKGAQSIDLSIKGKCSSFLRSLVNIKVTKESCVAGFCLVPSVNLGWLRTTPLTRGHYTSGFRGGTFFRPDFTTSNFHQTIDQLLVGAQFLVSRQGDIQLSIGYEGVFGKRSTVNEMNINASWNF
ncbi:Autotransporter beta-domain [Candidatus Rhabdochlamydia oedothoracis]|uniref:Autotransporter beta-domain n=1 Tax=Candidatus Rhabdochlamydia oedothoracis TaxID=2720720 RepID=A0ABX8UYE1_9BACT|nr:autotransporter outer membrane beta-barrel domain-containing protein [Candidatus Rhabdochlamydia oedothoracis]QYF47984.1 Autotransporter beta-domain [Candidatus Rhabdochlamydia oedothoracis]